MAERGFKLTERTSSQVAGLLSRNTSCEDRLFFRDPTAFEYFTKDCEAKPAGTKIKNREYADTLKAMGKRGADAFYYGSIAEDIATARELGTLAASPEEAWGNAAIPGFGIGAPTAQPELDERARQPETVSEEAHEDALAQYDIPNEELILSRGQKGEMAVYLGAPQAAVMHHDFAFALGVLGAFMAVFCALGLGAILTGTL